MDIITSPINIPEFKNVNEDVEEFSYCFFYRLEQYYIIAMPNQFC